MELYQLEELGLRYLKLGNDVYIPTIANLGSKHIKGSNSDNATNFIIDYCIRNIEDRNLILYANVIVDTKENEIMIPYTLGINKVSSITKNYDILNDLIEDGTINKIVSLTAVIESNLVHFINIEKIDYEVFKTKANGGILTLRSILVDNVEFAILGITLLDNPITVDYDVSYVNGLIPLIVINGETLEYMFIKKLLKIFDNQFDIEDEKTTYIKLIYENNYTFYIVPKERISADEKTFNYYRELVNKFQSYN